MNPPGPRLTDYRFSSRYATVCGHRLHYVDEGAGETVVFLHGNPTWSYLYRHIIVGLAQSFRCVAPDHLGFGFSDKPADADYSMRAHVMRLEAFVQALGLRDVTLVVQDWGGVIGLSWAVRHKHSVKRLVVLNTAGFVPESVRGLASLRPLPWGFPLLWALRLPGLGELFVQGMGGFVRYLLPLGTHHRERLSPEVMSSYLAPYPTWGSRRAQLASVRQVPMRPHDSAWQLLRETGAELTGWTVPTQIVWGMRDPVFVPWFLDEFERRLPNHAPTIRIDDASHFLQQDRPDVIVRAIRSLMSATHAQLSSHATRNPQDARPPSRPGDAP